MERRLWYVGKNVWKLVNLRRHSLEKRDAHSRKVIPVIKDVADALCRLANGNSFRTTIETWAAAKLTAVENTSKFCEMFPVLILSKYYSK